MIMKKRADGVRVRGIATFCALSGGAVLVGCSLALVTASDGGDQNSGTPVLSEIDAATGGSINYVDAVPADAAFADAAATLPRHVLCERSIEECSMYAADGGCTLQGVSGACRLQAGRTTCATLGPGGDGSPCRKSDDCGSGFDCTQKGVCRPYCCRGTCELGSRSACTIETALSDPSLRLPVCVSLRTCTLLSMSTCAKDETCSVVGGNGDTMCVGVGPRKTGEPCDDDLCARDLVCLGQFGSRKCFALCRTNDSKACGSGGTCRSSQPTFATPEIGICE